MSEIAVAGLQVFAFFWGFTLLLSFLGILVKIWHK